MTRVLDVYFANTKAGRLEQHDDGVLTFKYESSYLAKSDACAISVSIPLREEPYGNHVTQAYFSGLLPDEDARRRLARSLGVSDANTFHLLEIIGGECAGALALIPAGSHQPEDVEFNPEPLSDKQLAQVLELLGAHPLLGGMFGVRLSLAGAQNKLAVCVTQGQISLAKGGHPTTHILKPCMTGLDGTVENEMFCMRLAKKVGLPTPEVSMGEVRGMQYYLVERYDRTGGGESAIKRLHQEDFCQALSVVPQLKYEDEGGPGVTQSLELISRATREPASDRLLFLRMLIFHFLIGNADAHAKNYALLYRTRTPELAPVYDAISTAVYPSMTKRLAMRIGQRSLPDTIQLKHWLTLVPNSKPAQRLLMQELQTVSHNVQEGSAELIEQMRHEGIDHPVISKIRRVINTRTRHIKKILNA
mgnify:CR=1 FL=1